MQRRAGKRALVDTEHAQIATDAQGNVVQVTTDLILSAIDLHRLHELSFREAPIVRSARAARCAMVLSEGLNPGQDYDGVRAEDPFA